MRKTLFLSTLWMLVTLPQAAFAQAEARFTEVVGDVEVQTPFGQKLKAKTGAKIPSKSQVSAGADSSARVTIAGGAEVVIRQNTTVKLGGLRGDHITVSLLLGRLWAKVVSGTQFRVVTPTAVAGVRGTELETCQGLNGDARIDVKDGKVDMNGVAIGPGQSGQAAPGTTPSIAPTSSLPPMDKFEADANAKTSANVAKAKAAAKQQAKSIQKSLDKAEKEMAEVKKTASAKAATAAPDTAGGAEPAAPLTASEALAQEQAVTGAEDATLMAEAMVEAAPVVAETSPEVAAVMQTAAATIEVPPTVAETVTTSMGAAAAPAAATAAAPAAAATAAPAAAPAAEPEAPEEPEAKKEEEDNSVANELRARAASADALVGQVREVVSGIRTLLSQATAEGDTIKQSCIRAELTNAESLLSIAQQALGSLKAAAASGNATAFEDQYMKLEGAVTAAGPRLGNAGLCQGEFELSPAAAAGTETTSEVAPEAEQVSAATEIDVANPEQSLEASQTSNASATNPIQVDPVSTGEPTTAAAAEGTPPAAGT